MAGSPSGLRQHRNAVIIAGADEIIRPHLGGASNSRSWSTGSSWAGGTSWSEATFTQRVYEYAVAPSVLQNLPDRASLLALPGSARP